MKILIVVVVVIVIVVLLGWYLLYVVGRRPHRYKVPADTDLTKFFKALLYRGYANGLLMIETPKTKEPFLQFAKYIKEGESPGIQSDFPRAEWSLNYYEVLKVWLKNQGYEYEVIDADPTQRSESYKPVHEFISIDFKQDIPAASRFARFALIEVFGARADQIFHLYLMNGSPVGEKIGFNA